MEAIEFLKEYKRMCLSNNYCVDCKFREKCIYTHRPCDIADEMFKKVIAYVETWSKEHPIITNALKFKEVFGHKPQSINGIIFCPPVTPGAFECDRVDCMKCLEWWDKQYKEPENA